MKQFVLCPVLVFSLNLALHSQTQAGNSNGLDGGPSSAGRRAVVYVMPTALASPAAGDNPQVVVDSSRNDKEPQVAKTYQELQHRGECKQFSANMMKDKADYFLLLQHGGGKGNRWAVSDKQGNVIASGESLLLGSSVKDACLAMAKDWQQRGGEGAK